MDVGGEAGPTQPATGGELDEDSDVVAEGDAIGVVAEVDALGDRVDGAGGRGVAMDEGTDAIAGCEVDAKGVGE